MELTDRELELIIYALEEQDMADISPKAEKEFLDLFSKLRNERLKCKKIF